MRIKQPKGNWISKEDFNALPLDERALLLGAEDVGLGETPRGSNWGLFVKDLLARVGLYKPAPWCAAWVSSKLMDAGASRKSLPAGAASTYSWYLWAVKTKRLYSTPKRGMLFIWNDGAAGHIGFVVSVKTEQGDLVFTTIEGNTNDDGSREGYEVARRTRRLPELKKHVHWGFINVRGLP